MKTGSNSLHRSFTAAAGRRPTLPRLCAVCLPALAAVYILSAATTAPGPAAMPRSHAEAPAAAEIHGSAAVPRPVKQQQSRRAEEPGPAVTELPSLAVPNVDTSFKCYMDYRAITNRSSRQWALQQDAVTDENGFRRYNGYYMVALGTYYTGYECGKTFRITLDTGVSFDVITGDVKSDAHTDPLHQHRNGNVVEFIVDTRAIGRDARVMGDMSYCAAGAFRGQITEIEALEA